LNLSASLDGSYASSIIDGNIDRDFVATTSRTIAGGGVDAIGSASWGTAARSAILRRAPSCEVSADPIIWGGHFPSIWRAGAQSPTGLCHPRQGEETLREVLDAFSTAGVCFIAVFRGARAIRSFHTKLARFRSQPHGTLPMRAGPRHYLAGLSCAARPVSAALVADSGGTFAVWRRCFAEDRPTRAARWIRTCTT